MFDLAAIQQTLREFGLDGWLLYDFRASNVLARRVLDMEGMPTGSRRFFYMIPAAGEPTKLVHRIETAALDHLPGGKLIYLTWQELETGIAQLIAGKRKVAMEFAPRVSNPYVSKVDAGTVELVRSLGMEVASSGDLIQQFEATWDDDQWQSHRAAEVCTTSAYDLAWSLIAQRVKQGGTIREMEVQSAIMDHFHRHGMTTYSPPIVGVGPHSGNPHYEPQPGSDGVIGKGDFVLIDLWCKLDQPRAVYSDLTRVGFVGETVPEQYETIFAIVARARDAAIARVRDAFAAGRCAALKWTTPAGRSSPTPATARTSSTAPATASARKFTATAPTWTIWKPTRNAWSCAGLASRSSLESTWPRSACAARSTSSSTPRAKSTSPADCSGKSCQSWRNPQVLDFLTKS
ncbi:MAG: M24 family metallopeptidase [Isosphaeraceae bacterium]